MELFERGVTAHVKVSVWKENTDTRSISSNNRSVLRSFLRYDPGFGELYSPDRLERSVSANYLFTELHVDLHKAAFVCKKTLNDMDIQLETEMQITLNSVDERLRGASFVPYPEGYILV